MRPLELVRNYLRDPAGVDPSQVGHPFVTISRQSCAGGHRLARAIVAPDFIFATLYRLRRWDGTQLQPALDRPRIVPASQPLDFI